MNLNRRDLEIYSNFLRKIKEGTGDKFIDKHIPVLARFIELKYVSDDEKIYDLDDFIQECTIIIDNARNTSPTFIRWSLENKFQAIYKQMKKSEDYKFVKPI